MTKDQFWEIVDRVHRASGGGVDIGAKDQLLGRELGKLPLQEIQSFVGHFHECLDRAYSYELWGAAYIIQGGCSDDSFWDFRSSLISMGRSTFEGALSDPESLVALGDDAEEVFYEGYQYVASRVAKEMGGKLTRAHPHPKEPSGHNGEESELAGMFPKLTERYDYSGE
jgi:uncharacterized protein DUF4240